MVFERIIGEVDRDAMDGFGVMVNETALEDGSNLDWSQCFTARQLMEYLRACARNASLGPHEDFAIELVTTDGAKLRFKASALELV